MTKTEKSSRQLMQNRNTFYNSGYKKGTGRLHRRGKAKAEAREALKLSREPVKGKVRLNAFAKKEQSTIKNLGSKLMQKMRRSGGRGE